MSMAMTQDIMWVERHIKEIFDSPCFAYFVPQDPTAVGQVTKYYAIVALQENLKERNPPAWRRLTKDGGDLNLQFYVDSTKDREQKGMWKGCILDNPDKIDALKSQHPVEKHELVLSVVRPRKTNIEDTDKLRGPEIEVATFGNRSEANEALKQGNEQ